MAGHHNGNLFQGGNEFPKDLPAAGIFVAVFAVLLILFATSAFLARSYHAEQQAIATRHFEEGNRLVNRGDDRDAVEQFRAALTFARDNQEYELALALALMRMGKEEEAETHLNELIQADPTNGIANLAMARIAEQSGQNLDAEMYFQRAIYGYWPATAEADRLKARFELANLLQIRGEKQALLGELMLLRREVPTGDVKLKERVGQLFLSADSPSTAAEVFREVLQKNREDAQAYAGLGQAAFALGDYISAQGALRSAVRLNARDAESQKLLESSNAVLALDPALRGLSTKEKYQRSQRLLALVLSKLDLCVVAQKAALDPSLQSMRDAAEKTLSRKSKQRETAEAVEANLSTAQQLWQARRNLCPQAVEKEDPVALVLAKIFQSGQG
jgi:tetratricopeptide (TPR) repeat protein